MKYGRIDNCVPRLSNSDRASRLQIVPLAKNVFWKRGCNILRWRLLELRKMVWETWSDCLIMHPWLLGTTCRTTSAPTNGWMFVAESVIRLNWTSMLKVEETSVSMESGRYKWIMLCSEHPKIVEPCSLRKVLEANISKSGHYYLFNCSFERSALNFRKSASMRIATAPVWKLCTPSYKPFHWKG